MHHENSRRDFIKKAALTTTGLAVGLYIKSSGEVTGANDGPYFGNGFRNGWADQNSVVIWTRLTQNPEMKVNGMKFKLPANTEHKELKKCIDEKKIYDAQIPEGYQLVDMEGACPGANGEVRLTFYPENKLAAKQELTWIKVDPDKDFTAQWKLDTKPGTRYMIVLEARTNTDAKISSTTKGTFLTPPAEGGVKDINFCIVTCHDYLRRDNALKGHQIYPVMLNMAPDFYVHTGDVEYYDKQQPYALTEALMRFKWNRIFALPYQRDFFRQITTYFMKDDHDTLCDDAYPGMTYGTVSFERGLEIFDKEQFPASEKPYKTIRWGKDLQIWLVEGRNFRSKNNAPDGPGKTIWGEEQKEWFFRTIKASDATFKILISPTPVLGPDRNNKHDNYSNTNFEYEGDQLRQFINEHDNIFICNGDRHWQYVTHWENTNLWEFGCGPGSDKHAEGWNEEDKMPAHRFLRVKGGFLKGYAFRENDVPVLKLQHFDVDGNKVHEEVFRKK
ncbi:alkaline phosphatase D family protein [Chitinophaga sp. MM2321]|uniref:alkaline phosphatase D family protein n=1 Tax=Chitinophaga sp. MM2321 TaxID=3137178 RepID=UPI0032D59A43